MGTEGRGAGFDGPPENINKGVILLPESWGDDHTYDGGETYSKPEQDEKEKKEVLVVETEVSDKSKEKSGSKEEPVADFEVKPEDVLTPEEYESELKAKEEARKRREAGFTHVSGVIGEDAKGLGHSDDGTSKEEASTVDREKERNEKRDKIKDLLVSADFLAPKGKEKDGRSDAMSKVFETLKNGTKSFSEINNVINDFEANGERSSYRVGHVEDLKNDKQILIEAVNLAVDELIGGDPTLVEHFYLGSKHVDSMMDSSLAGLGWEISKNFVGSVDVNAALNSLEITRQSLDTTSEANVKMFLKKEEAIIDRISKMDFTDESEVKQQDKVVERLNAELLGLTPKEKKEIDPELKRVLEYIARTKRRVGHRADDIDPGEDFDPGGIDLLTGDMREAKYYSRFDITAAAFAMALKVMDIDGARFDAYRPTEWYKALPKETRDAIDVMMEVGKAASATYYYGKDTDKFVGSKVTFNFTLEKMRTLFNSDFKLVMSKMLNDLCEEYQDQNLLWCMRYKEGLYQLPKMKKSESEGRDVYDLAANEDVDDEGFLLRNGERILLDEKNEEHRKIGKRGLAPETIKKIRFIEDYKDELAYFLAEQKGDDFFMRYEEDIDGHRKGEFIMENGKRVPNPLCNMYANTAWNLWYGMGDSSLADRMRVLPTWDKIISDGLRTLNPEYKALSKWMIWKSGGEKTPKDLEEAEYFSGEVGDYVIKVMQMERDLAKARYGEKSEIKEVALDGKKTMRQKILEGEAQLMPDKMMYGFFDFVNGGRDLVRGDGKKFFDRFEGQNEKLSLAQLLMRHAYKKVEEEVDGKKVKKTVFVTDVSERLDFDFKADQVSFMNEFRDAYEAAVLMNSCIMGKADAKNPEVWARTIKSAQGMVNGIKFNNERYFKYTKSPELWRAMVVAAFGADKNKMSSDYIPIIRPPTKGKFTNERPYSFVVYDLLTKNLGLSKDNVDLVRVMQLLGVRVKQGQNPRGEWVRSKTERLENRDRRITRNNKGEINTYSEVANRGDKKKLSGEFKSIEKVFDGRSDFLILKKAFVNAINRDDVKEAGKIIEAMRRLK